MAEATTTIEPALDELRKARKYLLERMQAITPEEYDPWRPFVIGAMVESTFSIENRLMLEFERQDVERHRT